VTRKYGEESSLREKQSFGMNVLIKGDKKETSKVATGTANLKLGKPKGKTQKRRPIIQKPQGADRS